MPMHRPSWHHSALADVFSAPAVIAVDALLLALVAGTLLLRRQSSLMDA